MPVLEEILWCHPIHDVLVALVVLEKKLTYSNVCIALSLMIHRWCGNGDIDRCAAYIREETGDPCKYYCQPMDSTMQSRYFHVETSKLFLRPLLQLSWIFCIRPKVQSTKNIKINVWNWVSNVSLDNFNITPWYVFFGTIHSSIQEANSVDGLQSVRAQPEYLNCHP